MAACSLFIYIGGGLVTLGAGCFERDAGTPSLLFMLRGAIVAANGAYLAIRNHVKTLRTHGAPRHVIAAATTPF